LLGAFGTGRKAGVNILFSQTIGRDCPGGVTGKRFCQPDELPDFPDFFRKRFAREFLPHFQFHGVGS
jgi:hypothetical protein